MATEFPDKFQAEADQAPFDQPPRSRGWTGCLVGCLVLFLIGLCLCGGVGVYLYRNAADLARSAIVSGIQQSELDEAEKRDIIGQVDRVVDRYKSGQITPTDLQRIMEELTESPLMGLIMIASIDAKYITPSGLSPDEKQEARRTLQRVLRGVTEEQLSTADLEPATDRLMVEQADGSKQLKETVSDQELRTFLAELKQQADQAEIPDEPYEVKISDEFRKAIDRALGGEEGPTPE